MVENDALLEELKKIRTLLEPKPAPPAPVGFKAEFVTFVKNYKVMGLAVAFILGLYLGALVQSIVNGFIMPLIGLALPGDDWATAKVWVFQPGLVLSALITFLIVCLVIFILVRNLKKWGID